MALGEVAVRGRWAITLTFPLHEHLGAARGLASPNNALDGVLVVGLDRIFTIASSTLVSVDRI